MEIIRGKLQSAQKVVCYGPEGIGKSTFAAQFPNPIFIDTEGSTKHMDVARFPKPTSWNMLLEEVREVKTNPSMCGTLVLDTADWAEQLCVTHVCDKAQKSGIEDFGYGKGYTYVSEEFGRLLNLLEEVVDRGVNVVITAHAKMRKFEQPDEMGAYDRWEMKLSKSVEPLVKEWSDMVLFANYKTFAVATDDKGKKFKAQGGSRVMHTTHHPCWDAKNRQGLEPELPFDFKRIAHCIPMGVVGSAATPTPTLAETPRAARAVPVKAGASIAEPGSTPPHAPSQPPTPTPPSTPSSTPSSTPTPEPTQQPTQTNPPVSTAPDPQREKPPDIPPQREEQGIPKELADLMEPGTVTPEEIQVVVAAKGYYPEDMPISGYDQEFIKGVLIGAWPQVFGMIERLRAGKLGDVPF